MKFEIRSNAGVIVLAVVGALLSVAQASRAQPAQAPTCRSAAWWRTTRTSPSPCPPASRRPRRKAYSPYAGRKYPTRVLWGDTHLHSANSGDAFTTGNRFTPEQTYRIARGEEVISATGLPARLSRPLDFVVLSDHAEGLGLITQVYEGNPKLMGDSTVQRWSRMIKAGGTEASSGGD